LTAVIHRTKAIPSYEKGNGKVEKTPPISNKLLRGDPKNTGQQRMPPLTEVEQNLQAHMIEKQRLAESDLLSSLYRVLIENHDLPSGLRAALQIVCQITGWVVGTVWLPSDNQRQMRFYSFGIKTIQSSLSSLAFASSNRSPATLASKAEFGPTEKMNRRAI
jgi:hypothetical protein